ncbi:MAG: bifunctional phosphopantothenoylcysteine decarboxylase/phosphopantothenate--cysteine ligase CoaBC [Alphaproteobacteria bacterium]|nr:bifunctional phosphopantothenoylcysteine decarboxylase/phosphopantothenate--cysteine ligase CoaBC [Alphaproteobacteria bacterium]
MRSLEDKKILLVISGGIAAYKALELIRLIKKAGGTVRCILTKGGTEFVTPLSVTTLSEEPVYTDLWSLKDETEIGHIRLSREADLIVVAPASADFLAKIAQGLADDLASTTLLASNKPVLIAPAMNPEMWESPATQANLKTLIARGVLQAGPERGDTACGETGRGRMSEAETIFDEILSFFYDRPLKDLTALVTAGPTYEPIDPVRFIGNRSSGKQGYAIAAALHETGAAVTLISGPTALPDIPGVKMIRCETAHDMLKACEYAIPCDLAICAAAVSDWRPAEDTQPHKIKKKPGAPPPTLTLQENPDILKTLSTHVHRPALVIGFAAETENLLDNAKEKLSRKGCDWILANNIAPDANSGENIFGGDENHVYLVSENKTQDWGRTSKKAVARKLASEIAVYFNNREQ